MTEALEGLAEVLQWMHLDGAPISQLDPENLVAAIHAGLVKPYKGVGLGGRDRTWTEPTVLGREVERSHPHFYTNLRLRLTIGDD